jgi:RNA polymerase sigma-70 factor (ECF subfamily)
VVTRATVAALLPEGFCESEQVVDYGAGPAVVAETQSDAARLEGLMLGYQRADTQALSQLVAQLSPMLLRFLAGPVKTRPYAEDMLQDCWLRIHKARHTYRPGTPVLPWVFAIARYTRVDFYRRRRRIDDRELALDDWSGGPASPAAASQGSDTGLWKLVAQLPARQQEVIRMLKILGMSLEEVASATGASVGAVKQRAHRAYENLRVLLQQQARAEGDGR